jgi:uncharacterized protein (TIGR02246 family)
LTVKPEDRQKLVQVVIDATEQTMKHVPGFISASIDAGCVKERRMHMSPDRPSRICVAVLMIGAFAALLIVAGADARAERLAGMQSRSVSPNGTGGVAQISVRWAKAWSAKNLDAVIAMYADDAVFLPSIGSRITGRAAIRDLFEKALAVNTSDLHVQSRVTEQSSDLAYDSGEYEETTTSGGIARSGRGSYLVVFRRDGKNQWRIVEHMWTDVPTTKQ